MRKWRVSKILGRFCSRGASLLALPARGDKKKVFKRVKAIPLQTWTGPKCSRMLRLPDYMTIGT
jgi:hypothetical protein